MNIAHDFPDSLSPMLVKELRQGMRSKALISSLFLLQGLLILNAIVGLAAAEEGDLTGTTALFWTILSLPLLIILPLSALGGIGNEIKANTLDLVFLTRLTARRIVLGKWIAVVAQAVLLATTVLPYIALRYYLGGVNITADLLSAGALVVVSAMISALTVALSSYPSKVVRIFIGIGFFFSLQMLAGIGAAFMVGGRFGLISVWGAWPVVAAVVLLIPLFIVLMIEVGSIRIAPAAENHAGMCRLLALLALVVTGAAGLITARAEWMIILGQVMATPFCIAALCEAPPVVPGVFRPLVRRGPAGRALAVIFTPGWHTGVLYVLLVWFLLWAFWQQAGWLDGSAEGLRRRLSLLAFGASLLIPAIIAPALSRKRIFYYMGFFGLSLVIFLVTGVLSEVGSDHSEWINATCFLPPLAVFAPAFDSLQATPQLIWTGFLLAVTAVVYWLKSRTVWQQFAKLRALARTHERQNDRHAARD